MLDTFRKELYFARIEKDAEQLRTVIREEVTSLCTQSSFQGHDFIFLPPPLPHDDVPEFSEEERAAIPEIYCRRKLVTELTPLCGNLPPEVFFRKYTKFLSLAAHTCS